MPGYVFSDQIADMIKSGCRKTIIILSPDYIESEWCSYEARLALHQSPGQQAALRHLQSPNWWALRKNLGSILVRKKVSVPFQSLVVYGSLVSIPVSRLVYGYIRVHSRLINLVPCPFQSPGWCLGIYTHSR